MNLLNAIEKIELTNLIFVIILVMIIYILRMISSIMGISYALTIMDTPYKETLKRKKTLEYLVIIISIIWVLLKAVIFKMFITYLILIPLIIYCMINNKNRKAKGIAFLILNAALLFF